MLEPSSSGATVISVNKPNNAYIINSSYCCEVVAITNEEDEDHNKMVLCRVYETAQPLFVQPCDSLIIGAYKVHAQKAHMKLLSVRCLERRAQKLYFWQCCMNYDTSNNRLPKMALMAKTLPRCKRPRSLHRMAVFGEVR